jgi:hypothetical protein
MDLSPAQRRLTFGLIVLVLIGLAVWLLGSAVRGTGAAPSRPLQHTSSRPAPSASSPASPAQGESTPVQGSSPAAGGAPDIYQWLPFTQSGLAAATSVAHRFCVAYGTFSYAENATAYMAPLNRLSSAALAGQIDAAYSLPGVAAVRSKTRQVSAGSAVIESIRAFGPGSITFVVDITERQTSTSGATDVTSSYAITLTGTGTSWQVTDIELADLGNS